MVQKKRVLLLEDDPKTTQNIVETLFSHEVIAVDRSSDFFDKIKEIKPQALLIDFDLKEKDGLLVYREVRQKYPNNKTVMFSSSNSIPLAVAATKLGVLDFLRKPMEPNALRISVDKALQLEELPFIDVSKIKNGEWLIGSGDTVRKLLDRIRTLSAMENDLAIISEKGIDAMAIAELLHLNGRNKNKRFVEINLSSFEREVSETHFFLTIKELLSASNVEETKEKGEIPGTIFLHGMDLLPESFRLSILQFIREKKNPARVILNFSDPRFASSFDVLELPPLRKRKEDIVIITLEYIKNYCPEIKYISPEVLEFLMFYDFPGNYVELKDLIISSYIGYSSADILSLKNLEIDSEMFKKYFLNKMFMMDKYDLREIRPEFEKIWTNMVMEKLNRDVHLVARFFDVPKGVLIDRIKKLGLPE